MPSQGPFLKMIDFFLYKVVLRHLMSPNVYLMTILPFICVHLLVLVLFLKKITPWGQIPCLIIFSSFTQRPIYDKFPENIITDRVKRTHTPKPTHTTKSQVCLSLPSPQRTSETSKMQGWLNLSYPHLYCLFDLWRRKTDVRKGLWIIRNLIGWGHW